MDLGMLIKRILNITNEEIGNVEIESDLKKDVFLIISVIGVAGASASVLFSVLVYPSIMAILFQIISAISFCVFIILVKKTNISIDLLSVILIGYQIVSLLGMWSGLTLINYFVYSYVVYTVVVAIVLLENKRQLIVGLLGTAIIVSMLIYDMMRSQSKGIDLLQYKTVVLGSLIIGIMIIMVVSQYKSYLSYVRYQLYNLSLKDSMTDVFNTRYLEEQLIAYTRLWKEQEKIFSCALIDFDNLKTINDRFGHYKGDEVIISIVNQIKETISENDEVYRYGGDEFAVVFPGLDKLSAKKRLTGVLDNKLTIMDDELQEKIAVTISVGLCDISEVKDDKIIKLADARLYKAKENGKNRINID